MAVPFPRSIRSLNADGFRFTLLSLIVAGVLFLLWTGWFFGATVTLHETSASASLLNGDLIEARFDRQQLRRIARGQQARFFPNADADIDKALAETGVPALVTAVNQTPDGSQTTGEVLLVVTSERRRPPPRILAERLEGRVDIAVEQLTPARLTLQAAGLGSGQ